MTPHEFGHGTNCRTVREVSECDQPYDRSDGSNLYAIFVYQEGVEHRALSMVY